MIMLESHELPWQPVESEILLIILESDQFIRQLDDSIWWLGKTEHWLGNIRKVSIKLFIDDHIGM